MKKVKEQVQKLLSEIMLDEKMDIFDAFANKLHAALEQIVSGQPKSADERQAMWEKYHKLHSINLPVIWKAFYQGMAMECDIMVSQLANDNLFNELIWFHCPTDVAQLQAGSQAQQEEMSELEESIIRYASGYVPIH